MEKLLGAIGGGGGENPTRLERIPLADLHTLATRNGGTIRVSLATGKILEGQVSTSEPHAWCNITMEKGDVGKASSNTLTVGIMHRVVTDEGLATKVKVKAEISPLPDGSAGFRTTYHVGDQQRYTGCATVEPSDGLEWSWVGVWRDSSLRQGTNNAHLASCSSDSPQGQRAIDAMGTSLGLAIDTLLAA